jgi:hypothetical protein
MEEFQKEEEIPKEQKSMWAKLKDYMKYSS